MPEELEDTPRLKIGRRRKRWWLVAGGAVFAGCLLLVAAAVVNHLMRRPERSGGLAAPPKPVAASPRLRPLAPLSPEATVDEIVRRAREVAARLVERFPESAHAYCAKGRVEFRFGHSAEAVRCWEKCLQLDPGYVEAYYQLAVAAMDRGDNRQAAQLLEEAVRRFPQAPLLANQLAKALMNQGKLDEAMAVLLKSLRSAPGFAGNFFLAGQIALLKQDYETAAEYFQAALEIHPSYSHACLGLATAYARLGEEDKAKQYRQRFADLRAKEEQQEIDELRQLEDRATVVRSLAHTYGDAGKVYLLHGEPAEAERYWRAAMELDAQDTESRQALAELYVDQGRRREALEMYGQLTKIEPQRAEYFLQMGQLQAELGDVGAAEQSLRRCCQLAPERAFGYTALARLYLRKQLNVVEASRLAEKAVQLEPTAAHWFLLSAAREGCGDRNGALAALEKAIQLDPGNSVYRQAYESFRK